MFLKPVPYSLPTDRPLCFLHVPKTAGTSFSAMMEQVYGPGEICPAHFWTELVQMPREDLDRYAYIGAHTGYDVRELLSSEPIFITFLREPIDRLLSYFYYARREPRSIFHHDLTLEAFLHSPDFYWITRNGQTHFLGTDEPITYPSPASGIQDRTAVTYRPATEATLAKAKQRLEQFGLVGLQGHFQASIDMLCYTLGWPSTQIDHRKNTTAGRKDTSEIPRHLLDKMHADNPYDRQLYAFAQTLFQRRREEVLSGGSQSLAAAADQRYREVFRAQFPPEAIFQHDMRHALPGSGWHAAEVHAEHGIYRWTGQSAYTDLPLASGVAHQVDVHVIGAIQPSLLAGLHLTVNGQPVVLTQQPGPHHSAVYRGHVPTNDTDDGGPVRLTLTVPETHSPASLSMNDDTRELGVAVASITATQIH